MVAAGCQGAAGQAPGSTAARGKEEWPPAGTAGLGANHAPGGGPVAAAEEEEGRGGKEERGGGGAGGRPWLPAAAAAG